MTSIRDIALTAGFLISGMRDFCEFADAGICYDGLSDTPSLLSIWGQGCFELHAELTQYAPLVAQLCDDLYTQLNEGFPGMWDYQVTEALGSRIAAWIVAHDGQPPYPDWVRAQLAQLACEFVSRADSADQPTLHKTLLSISLSQPSSPLLAPL